MTRWIRVGLLLCLACRAALGQGYVWTTQTAMGALFGGGKAVVDASGNVYVAGGFSGNLSIGSVALTNSGGVDIFLLKLNSAGNLLWATRAGGPGGDVAWDVALDPDGNVVIAGGFQDTAGFDASTITAIGGSTVGGTLTNMFVAKYTSAGSLTWVRREGGAAGGVAVDATGHIYTTGSTGSHDNFAVDKWDSSGTRIWHREYACAYSHGYSVKVDPEGNIFAAGQFSSAMTIGTNTLSIPIKDGFVIFLAKFDPSGEVIWARQTDQPGLWPSYRNNATSIALAPFGDVLITGTFSREIYFGTNQLATGSQDTDSFVAKCDRDGNFIWARTIARFAGVGSAVACDSAGNIYAVGSVYSSLVFNKYDSTGSLLWGLSAVSANYGYGHGIAVDTSDRPCVVSSCNGNISFDALSFTNQGGGDVFISQASEWVPPVITVPPRSFTVLGGSNVQLGCLTRSLVPVSYQWRHDGIDIPGATTSSLRLTSAQLPDQGLYDVIVTNIYGATTSAPASLGLLFKLTTHIAGSGNVSPSIGWTNIYPPFSNVTVRATPDPGFSFTGWFGDASGTENPLSVTITSNLHIWGIFSDASSNLVVDSADSNATFSGAWSTRVAHDGYGPDLRSVPTAASSSSAAIFRPLITVPGVYDVYVWHPTSSSASLRAPWSVSCHSGSTNMLLNQTISGGTWIRIASNQFFAAGTNGFVSVSNGTAEYSRYVLADAVRFLKRPPPPPQVRTPILSEHGLELSLIAVPGLQYSFQVSTNLTHWTTLATIPSTNSVLQILDADTAGVSRKFYRAVVDDP